MKKIGIWIDKRNAYIITSAKEENQRVVEIESQVEDYHISGGSGTPLKGGPQDVVQDSRYLEREKHQLKEYFKVVAQELVNADDIVIFGPAETGQKLRKELGERFPNLGAKVSALSKADSMTVNQMKAWVRAYFAE